MAKKLHAINTLLLWAGLCAAINANATLGSYPLTGADAHVSTTETLPPNSMSIASSPTAVSGTAYTVHVATLDSGVTVTEYVSTAKNQVFAVTWDGPAMPNLRQILGTAFTTFVSPPPAPSSSVTVRNNGLEGRSVSANGVVVHTHGVAGHFRGSAYISADFPPGVTLQSLRQTR